MKENIFIFSPEVFTEEEVKAITQDQAIELAQKAREEQDVFLDVYAYCSSCSTFASDFNSGALNDKQWILKTF